MKPQEHAVGRHVALSAAIVLLAGVSLSSIESALAGDVEGNVKSAPGAPAKPTPLRPAYWREWNGFIPPQERKLDLARDVTVVLVGDSGNTDASVVEFKGGDLFPRTVVLQKGASLRLRNTDDTSHELYAEGLSSFGPDETRPGMGRQVTLSEAGSWPLRDRLASHVRGHLHVLEKVTAVAQPGADGSFDFEDVEPGKYTLKVFYGPDEVASKPIDVSSRSLTVDPLLVKPRTR